MAGRRRNDAALRLALVVAGSAAAALLGLAGPPTSTFLGSQWLWVRVAAGLLAVLFLPGYALVSALFPHTADLDPAERIGLSLGLSAAHVPLVALALDRSPWGLAPPAIAAAQLTTTLTWCAVWAVRLRRGTAVPTGKGDADGREGPAVPGQAVARGRPASSLALPPSAWSAASLAAGIVVAGATVWTLAWVYGQPALAPLTEFYMLGGTGLAEEYPRSAGPGQPVTVMLGVANHEGTAARYFVVALHEARVIETIAPFELEAGGVWRAALTIRLPRAGLREQVDILLFRTGIQAPYRRLRLVLDVLVPGEPTPVRLFPTPLPGAR